MNMRKLLFWPFILSILMVLVGIIFVNSVVPAQGSAVFQAPTPTPAPLCGASDNPCHVIIDNAIDAPIPITAPYSLPVRWQTPKPITGTIDIAGTVPITITGPLTVTAVPPAWSEIYDRTLIALLAAIIAKIIILTLVDLVEKNLLLLIYRLLMTMLFVGVDIFAVYPQTRAGLSVGLYLISIALWAIMLIADAAYRFYKELTGERG